MNIFRNRILDCCGGLQGHVTGCDFDGKIPIDLTRINPEGFQLRRALEGSLKTFVKKNINIYKTKESKKEKTTTNFNGPIDPNKKPPREGELDVSGLLLED